MVQRRRLVCLHRSERVVADRRKTIPAGLHPCGDFFFLPGVWWCSAAAARNRGGVYAHEHRRPAEPLTLNRAGVVTRCIKRTRITERARSARRGPVSPETVTGRAWKPGAGRRSSGIASKAAEEARARISGGVPVRPARGLDRATRPCTVGDGAVLANDHGGPSCICKGAPPEFRGHQVEIPLFLRSCKNRERARENERKRAAERRRRSPDRRTAAFGDLGARIPGLQAGDLFS